MGRLRDSLVWGIIVLLVGLAFLLWNFGVFAQYQTIAQWVVVGIFAAAGIAFLAGFLARRTNWMLVIPGFVLLSLAVIVWLSAQRAPAAWIGMTLFLGIALAFAVIYLGDRQQNWWALIPFGTMTVAVLVILLSTLDLAASLLGAILFGSLGLVFFLSYALAKDRRAMAWALVPTAALLVMCLAALAAYLVATYPNLNDAVRLWPVLLVIAGVFMIGVSISRSTRPAVAPGELPAQPTPAEASAAAGTSVTPISEEPAAPRKPPTETAPVPLVDEPPSAPQAAKPGEVTDLYEFLKSAPPEK